MEKFLNRHKNKLCFVLGSGPSLRHVDVEILKKNLVIVVNSAILKAPFAQYLFGYDFGMTLLTSWLTLKDLKCELILNRTVGQWSGYDHATGLVAMKDIEKERITYFEVEGKTECKLEQNPKKLLILPSSVHGAVHLAYIMGCSPIVLLGCDCQYEDSKRYFTEFKGQPVNGFIRPEFKKLRPEVTTRVSSGDGYLGAIINMWSKIRNNNKEINIINASGGILGAFPRKSVKEIIKAYDAKV